VIQESKLLREVICDAETLTKK